LTGNNIGDEGVDLVIKSLGNKKTQALQKFCVSNNKITSAGCKSIVDFITTCKSIEEL
jgi:hypothetical protein